MNKNSIRICCSSFLIPSSVFWQPLGKYGSLDFGEYGDWPQALMTPDKRPLIWILFLSDLLNDDGDKETLNALLHPLAQRLKNNDEPVIVAWSSWKSTSPIQDARVLSPWRCLSRELEDKLYELATQYPALHLLNLDQALIKTGVATIFDNRNYYAARCRLSRQGLTQTATLLASIMERIISPAKKVLVLDCDNTLWGGVIGEVGLKGIVLGGDGTGKIYAQLQNAALEWARKGILLVLISKNNEDDVWQVFEQHPGMVLKRSDIIAYAINWQEKADNIIQLAEHLGLGLDSFVFVDDNPLEREKMRSRNPKTTTLELPDDITSWPELLASTDLFAKFYVTADDAKKNQQYRNRAEFVEAIQHSNNPTSFLKSIQLQPGILPLDQGTLARAEQLCAKTNQFNLRLQRYNGAELEQLSTESNSLTFIVTLKDKFGDHGMVGLGVARVRGSAAVLDTFLLSCRVLGRHLEAWMLNYIRERLLDKGCRWLIGQYCPGERNQMAENFLPSHGLVPITEKTVLDTPELLEVLSLLSPTGTQYCAELSKLTIPYLDLFTYADSNID